MLLKPIINKITSFDAMYDKIITFSVSGGNQVVKNKIIVKDNETNVVIYEKTIDSYRLENTIPSNTLTNGKYYNVSITTYDTNGNESEPSALVQFRCYTTPTLKFLNLEQNQEIEYASYDFLLEYNQIEGELLDFVQFSLYDFGNLKISESEILRATEFPPNVFNWIFEGFSDSTPYYIQVDGITINGTQIQSELVYFTTKISSRGVFTKIELENNSEEGYTSIESNLILIDAETNIDPIEYIDGDKVEVNDDGQYIKWSEGFSLDGEDFTVGIWMRPFNDGEVFRMYGESPNKHYQINLSLKEREKPYAELYGYENGQAKIYQQSNFSEQSLNNNSDIIIWARKRGNDYEVKLIVLYREENYLYWNGNSNVQYNKHTDIYWFGENPTLIEVVKNPIRNDINFFPITITEIKNGVFNNLHITSDISFEMLNEVPEWSYDTKLNVDFNGNIGGGNISTILSQVDRISIKRRELGTFDWITIYSKEVNNVEDFGFIHLDKIAPTCRTFEYAIVPSVNGVEGAYTIDTIETSYLWSYLTDGTTHFKFPINIQYGNTESLQTQGEYLPIESKYPIHVMNSMNDYRRGSLTAMIVDEKFSESRTIDDSRVMELEIEIDKFLKNKKSKVWKDWNGRIFLVVISGSPTIGYNTSGMNKSSMSIQWVEKGKWNIEKDLINNGFIEVY